jgi:hypothetical protein
MKLTEIVKGMWGLFPFRWMLDLLARIFIVSAVLSYFDSVGGSTFMVTTILSLWMLMPLYGLLQSFYYSAWGCQNRYTSLWNMLEGIRALDKASKKRIEATKLRIWVERNPEIHLFNYWFLKYLRRKEWKNIDIDDYDKLPSNKGSEKKGSGKQ